MTLIRLTLIAFTLLFSAPAFAECESEMGEYVIRGDHSASYVGARLWDLQKMKRHSKRANASACTKNLFGRGLTEMTDYWHHIGKKQGCLSDSLELRQTETCSQERYERVANNMAWLALMGAERKLDGCKDGKCGMRQAKAGPLNAANIEAILQATAAAVKPSADLCEGVPAKDRISLVSGKSPGSDFVEDMAKSTGSCIWGLIKGFFQEGLFVQFDAIKGLVTNPAAVRAALGDFATQMVKHPIETPKNLARTIGKNLHNQYVAKYDKWHCYNAQKQTELICSSIGQGTLVVAEAILGVAAFKAGATLVKGMMKGKAGAVATTANAPARLTGPGGSTQPALPAPAPAGPAAPLALPAPATTTGTQTAAPALPAPGAGGTAAAGKTSTSTALAPQTVREAAAQVGKVDATKAAALRAKLDAGKTSPGQIEAARSKLLSEVDDLAAKMKNMPDGPERIASQRRMNDLLDASETMGYVLQTARPAAVRALPAPAGAPALPAPAGAAAKAAKKSGSSRKIPRKAEAATAVGVQPTFVPQDESAKDERGKQAEPPPEP